MRIGRSAEGHNFFIGLEFSLLIFLPAFVYAATSYSRTPTSDSSSCFTFHIAGKRTDFNVDGAQGAGDKVMSLGLQPDGVNPSGLWMAVKSMSIPNSGDIDVSQNVCMTDVNDFITHYNSSICSNPGFACGSPNTALNTLHFNDTQLLFWGCQDSLLGNGAGVPGCTQPADPDFSYDFTDSYSLLVESASASGASPATTAGGSGPTEYNPVVTVDKPKDGDVAGLKTKIKYQATDQNDILHMAADRFGLAPNPVSLYYSDTLDKLNGGFLVDEKDKKLIQKNLPAEGAFNWDTSSLPERDNYRIVADVSDIFGWIGEAVSGLFSIDHSSPTFNVRAEPPVSHGENVKIIVSPSEKLLEAPQVFVTQRNYVKIQVFMAASTTDAGEAWQGVYEVRPGFDGPALVEVSGKDLIGNGGDTVLSGRTFSVGLEPPPKPIIVSPLDKDVFASTTIAIKGQVREDTEVILRANGKDEFKTKPDSGGIFNFDNVILSQGGNGINNFEITSMDTAGNISEAAALSVKFNLAPELSMVFPPGVEATSATTTVFATTTIKVSATDKNNDKLLFSYYISGDGGGSWVALAEGISNRQFAFDTKEFPDGNYLIRVVAGDGFARTEVKSGVFKISNFLPIISFTVKDKIISNKKDVVISGTIKSPAEASQKLAIALGEYSMDDGKTWLALRPDDGNFDSLQENFSLQLKDLKEGLYNIFFRAHDSRRYFGRAQKIVVVDFAPPVAPEVISPASGVILSNVDDRDPDTAGVQFEISGKAEANSEISAVYGNAEFKGRTDAKGDFKVMATLRDHGKNNFEIFATDVADNKSSGRAFSVVYNNPPILKFLNPREGLGVGGRSEIFWEARDLDLDAVYGVTLSYKKGDSPVIILGRNLKSNKFTWDTSGFQEGQDYALKLEATDGVSKSSELIHIAVDHTAPAISVDTLPKAVFTKEINLTAKGSAEDNLSGIGAVEFSIDGKNWFRTLLTSGFLQRNATFRLKQSFKLEDGKYELRIRAVDAAGNESAISSSAFIVDTKPPRIGSFSLSQGSISLLPASGANFEVTNGAHLKLTLSLEADTVAAGLSLGSKKINLKKNRSTGLWETDLSFPELGEFGFKISAEDAVGNLIHEKEIGKINVIKNGQVKGEAGNLLSGAKLNILTFNNDDQSWVRWQAEAYGEKNPVLSAEDGNYEMLLPPGKYQILLEKTGYGRVRTSGFEVLNPKFTNFDFTLKPRTGIKGFIEDLIEKISI